MLKFCKNFLLPIVLPIIFLCCCQPKYSTSSWRGEAFINHNKQQSQLVVGNKHMIATSELTASQVGNKILQQGGTAIDAAIAAQMVLNVIEPQSSGIGGGLFLLYHHNKSNTNIYFDGRETAPSKAFAEMFLDANGKVREFHSVLGGGLSVGTPGGLHALYTAHKKYGKLPWHQLFQPAIKLAQNGYPLSNKTFANLAKFQHIATSADMAVYFDNKKQPKPIGTIIKNPALAKTLHKIARYGIKPFYQGDIAKNMINKIQNSPINPGYLQLEDLKNYRSTSGELLCAPYRQYKVCSMPLPSSGGIAILQILGILQNFDLGKLQPNSVEAIHLISEATKLAYADRNQYVSDYASTPIKQMLDPNYLKHRASLINPKTAQQKVSYGLFNNISNKSTAGEVIEKPSTSHLSIVDKYGNAVAMTTSIEYAFGSALMVDGFLLNNQLTDFSMAPTNSKGEPVANRVQPNKKPRSSMSPTFVFDNQGRLIMALGSPNGPRIIQHVLKVLLAVLDWNFDIHQAVISPNFITLNNELELEQNSELIALKTNLQKMGHKVKEVAIPSGLQVIYLDRNSNKIYGVGDYRRNGVAIGK